MEKVAIKSNGKNGKDIIEYFKKTDSDLTLVSACNNLNYYYYKHYDGRIYISLFLPPNYTEIFLPGELTFPRWMMVNHKDLPSNVRRMVMGMYNGLYQAIEGDCEDDANNGKPYRIFQWKYAYEIPQKSAKELKIEELQKQLGDIQNELDGLK